jgi:TolA-binding protein
VLAIGVGAGVRGLDRAPEPEGRPEKSATAVRVSALEAPVALAPPGTPASPVAASPSEPSPLPTLREPARASREPVPLGTALVREPAAPALSLAPSSLAPSSLAPRPAAPVRPAEAASTRRPAARTQPTGGASETPEAETRLPSPVGAATETIAPASTTEPPASAAELLRRAQATRHLSWRAALPQYQGLIARHPRSTEAGLAEMVLAQRAREQAEFRVALRWFRRHQQRTGSPLVAEALWGEAAVLTELGDAAGARRALRRLTLHHPDTPYAAAARQQLQAGASARPQ